MDEASGPPCCMAIYGTAIWPLNQIQEIRSISTPPSSGGTTNVRNSVQSPFYTTRSGIWVLLTVCVFAEDVGNMATSRYQLGREWMEEYHKFFLKSAPEDDYEDRNALYAM